MVDKFVRRFVSQLADEFVRQLVEFVSQLVDKFIRKFVEELVKFTSPAPTRDYIRLPPRKSTASIFHLEEYMD